MMGPLLLGGILALSAQGGDFPTTQADQWAHNGLVLAVREGLLPERQGMLFGYLQTLKPASRYEFAVILHSAFTSHLVRTEDVLNRGGNDLERASLIRVNSLLPFYQRGAREFAPELRSLGVPVDFGLERLDVLARRLDQTSPPRDRLFSDVPVDHWAAKAVGDLRALGLLDGYPDGRFRG